MTDLIAICGGLLIGLVIAVPIYVIGKRQQRRGLGCGSADGADGFDFAPHHHAGADFGGHHGGGDFGGDSGGGDSGGGDSG